MSTRHPYRLVGGYYLVSTATCYASYNGGAWNSFSLGVSAAKRYFVSGDESLTDMFFLLSETNPYCLNTFEASTGRIAWSHGDAQSWRFSFYLDGVTEQPNSAALTDALINNGTKLLTVPAGGVTYSGPSAFSLYPRRLVVNDLGSVLQASRQSVNINGGVRTLNAGSRKMRTLEIRLANAWPRSAIRNELNAMEQFLAAAASGTAFRYYPDTSVQLGYDSIDYPYGYHVLSAVSESCNFEPEPEHEERHNQFVHELKCFEE